MNTRRFSAALFTGLVISATATASVDDEIQALKDQMRALTERLEQLERSNTELQADNRALAQDNARQESAVAALEAQASTAGEAAAASWTDNLRWQGDFRYRYEHIDLQNVSDRNRNRIRARAALVADLGEDLEVGVGLATGGLDPVSANVTLGGGGAKKELALDQAYFAWSGLSGTRITGGKFKQIIETAGDNQLLWDSDWRPEGLGVEWRGGNLFATGLGTWLEGDSNRGTSFTWIAQAGIELDVGDDASLTAAVGWHEIDTAGRSSYFGDSVFQGNSFDPVTGTYLYDYVGAQAFIEFDTTLFGLPFQAFGEYVQNQEAPDHDTGYLFGLSLGSARAPGGWSLGWYYEELARDAALGLLVDSDFGLGGTDARGNVFKGAYGFRQNVSASFAVYLTEVGEDRGAPMDVNRFQLDLNFKY